MGSRESWRVTGQMVADFARAICDALSGTAFTDDRYVTDLHVTKTMRSAGDVDVMVVRVRDVER